MPRWIRYSLFPAAIGLSALFIVLPQTGADAIIKIVGPTSGPRFVPAVATVKPGARIAFENDTRATETATCISCGAGAWDSGDVQPGQTVFVTLPRTSGSFDYGSRYDQNLVGRLHVGVSETISPTPLTSS